MAARQGGGNTNADCASSHLIVTIRTPSKFYITTCYYANAASSPRRECVSVALVNREHTGLHSLHADVMQCR
ncbi:hypothetical protein E2C01_089569 [Portunus trituberculatus]|uniref:Uncharacterized protein n=1 Tax=Portunus trituberculatus TaxID=210409 RepID=A0A5B7J952_PORTR|nr:hypothetical protein [Portunus trituberculatus]